MIYFLSLFLIAASVSLIDCIDDSDCTNIKCKPPRIPRCTESLRCNCLLPFVPKIPWSTKPKRVSKIS
ncbi:hypothetical protein P8452_33287 [Trifolium repens]|nr:hypothetical protein P8452_33287 [Trifolium repens]